MAKRVRVSDDSGATWYTLPGNTAELTDEAGDIKDTIYGQDYASSQTGLIATAIKANGLYKGFAGYVATLKKSGTPTTLTDEPMSLVSGKTYKVTDATKQCFDRNTALSFKDDGSALDPSNIESVDYLFGRVTLKSSYTPAGAITVASGKYLPLATIGRSNGFTLKQTTNAIDNTDYDSAQENDGHHTYEYGLRTVSLDIQGIYSSSNDLRTMLQNRAEIVIEVNPDGAGKSVARGFFKPMSTGQSGDVGDLEAQTTSFALSVPDDEAITVPFSWIHDAGTTLNVGIQKLLSAWTAGDLITISYLPDGLTGVMGDAVITDLSLAGGLEVMNEFTVDAQISGETEPVEP
jgi:hypothetical protein